MSWLNYFKKWAKTYDFETKSYGYDPSKLIKPFLHSIGKREVGLDIGCGTGKSLEVISKFCTRVVGVEPVEKMAKQAENKGYQVIRMRGEDIGQLKAKFDFISFFASIDYLDSLAAIKGLKKIITKDSVVFITLETQNKEDVVGEFKEEDFKVLKEETMRAYEGQDYKCILLAPKKS